MFAAVEHVGPFTLFVANDRTGLSYYARPTLVAPAELRLMTCSAESIRRDCPDIDLDRRSILTDVNADATPDERGSAGNDVIKNQL